jgi:hypothetical protein
LIIITAGYMSEISDKKDETKESSESEDDFELEV